MLLHIPQVLTAAEVAAFRERLDAAPWVDGRHTVGAQGAQVKRNRQLDAASELARELGQAVTAAVFRQPRFVSAALPRHVLPPFFNRYGEGEHYGDHVDGAVRFLPDGQPMRTDVSATLFLAGPDDYDGGDLVVRDTYGEHMVKLPAGDLVLYPSTSLHRVEPVTRGERVAAFMWMQSMVRDNGRRTMLFDLDQSIQSLRARLGDGDELVALTGVYHNLMRQWAEV